MSKKVKELQVDSDVKLVSAELDVCDALDIVADIMSPLGNAQSAFSSGRADPGEAIGMLAKEFTGGGLTRHLIRLLSCTTLSSKSENLRVDLINSREKFNQAFAGRHKYLAPAVKLALEVSIAGFLDGLELIGIKKPSLAAPASANSTPSTDDTGPSSASG